LLQTALTGRRIKADRDIGSMKGYDYRDCSLPKQRQPKNSIVAEVYVQKSDVVGADQFQ
jgi:hypothetical protein